MTIISSDTVSNGFGRIFNLLDFWLFLVNFRGKKSAKLSDKSGSADVSPPAPDLTGSLWLSKIGVGTYFSFVYSAELEIFIFLLEGSPESKNTD